MTTKLEKWVMRTLRGDDHWYKIGLSEGKHLGFKHAVEVLESLAFTPEFRSKDPNVLAGYVNAIRFLKQYAEEDK